MNRRAIALALLCLGLPASVFAQASTSSRAEIYRMVYAEESAARIEMPLGGEGVQLTDLGKINEEKLRKEIQKNGASILVGRIVKITGIEFNSKSIDIELDGGGKAKKRLGDRIQVSVGGGAPPVQQQPSVTPKAIGSKISLMFGKNVPENLTANQLKELLAPVLDFTKHTVTSSNIESLPPEIKEAVLAKEAIPGMDEDTVLLAMGKPDRKFIDKVNGVEQEKWMYIGPGVKRTFVTFEKSIVVAVLEDPGQ